MTRAVLYKRKEMQGRSVRNSISSPFITIRFVENNIRFVCKWKQVEVMELAILAIKEDHIHLLVNMPLRYQYPI